MTRNVITLPRAEADIFDAYFYFEQRRPGLGDEFLGRIEELYARISDTPEYMQPFLRPGLGEQGFGNYRL